ncbi:hypothetical protein BH11PSE11_BH11PSE11_27960 [soil metagenome]
MQDFAARRCCKILPQAVAAKFASVTHARKTLHDRQILDETIATMNVRMNADDLLADKHRLILALQSGRELAFDWRIPEDALQFVCDIPDSFSNVPLSGVNSSMAIRQLVHENDQPLFLQEVGRVLKFQSEGVDSVRHMEIRLRDSSLGWLWVELYGRVVERDSEGRALRAVGAFTDINTRKLTEDRAVKLRDMYAALSQTNHAMLHITDRQTLFDEICRIAVEHGHFQISMIRLLDQDSGKLIPVAGHGKALAKAPIAEISIDGDKPEGRGPGGTSVRENRPSICNDFLARPFHKEWIEIATKVGFRSVGSFPFHRDGVAIGALMLYSESTDYFDRTLVELLEQMTQEISFALENFEQEKRRVIVEAALSDSEKFNNAILLAALDCIISFDDAGNIIDFNPAAERSFGLLRSDVLGKPFIELILAAESREQQRQKLAQFLATGDPTTLNRRVEMDAVDALGHNFPVEIAIAPITLKSRSVFTAYMRDISVRKLSEQLQLAQNHVLNMIAAGTSLLDILSTLNQLIEAQSGRGLCSIQLLNDSGSALSTIIAASLPAEYGSAIERFGVGDCNASFGTAVFRQEPVFVADIANDPLWTIWRDLALPHGLQACSSWPIFGKNNKVLGALSMYYAEVTEPNLRDLQLVEIAANLAGIAIENKDADDRIRFLAHYDEMTSLPNRALFNQILNHAMEVAHRNQKKLAVLFVDLDRFKNINDTFGHVAGDQALQEIAERFRTCLRKVDTVARMGGDEFFILLEDLSQVDYTSIVAQKILAAASRPFYIDQQECQLSASIGIAVYPDDGIDALSLLKNSDIAMYRAKSDGKNGFQFYSPDRNIHSIGRLALESQLRRAIENREFILYYQPKVELATGRITGVEALVRWQHPQRGLVPPNEFIPLAEETRLIIPLSKQILEIACRDAIAINATLRYPIRVAVNLSVRQLDDKEFLNDLKDMLVTTGLPADLLQLEITESMVMHNAEQAVSIMSELRSMGIRLDIDDFGTGYSSLAYLKRFPVYSLKIDRSFIQDVPNDPNDTAITLAIIAMGHTLGLRVVAEGVETAEQMESLRQFGCDEMQGFYFSRPITLEAFLDLHEKHLIANRSSI